MHSYLVAALGDSLACDAGPRYRDIRARIGERLSSGSPGGSARRPNRGRARRKPLQGGRRGHGSDGAVFCTQLETVNGYSFTAMAAAEAGHRVLSGEQIRGFQTPAGLFGQAFVECIGDSRIIEISLEGANEE